jgi:hypothetical protein
MKDRPLPIGLRDMYRNLFCSEGFRLEDFRFKRRFALFLAV